MPARRSRSGQAYLETLLVLLALLLVLFGFLQVALSNGDAEVVHHAAARAARARAVGFNDWMALKAARVATIPSAGKLLSGNVGYDPAEDGSRTDFELARIPEYLAAETSARAQYVLDYEEWERGWPRERPDGSLFGGSVLHSTVRFEAPLAMPLAGWFFPRARLGEDGVRRLAVERSAPAGEHSTLYLR